MGDAWQRWALRNEQPAENNLDIQLLNPDKLIF
jgi:hypothetical protein